MLTLIGDVAGKGVEAAGVAETVRIAARATALASASPQRILRVGHRLVADDPERFVTALVVVLDPATGEVLMASAGHVPPAHVSDAGCVLVEPRYGHPLGSLTSEYPPRRFSMGRGDTLVLYTDGVTEARRDGELFGEERLLEVLCRAGRGDPQALVEGLRAAVLDFAGELSDDLQILALRLI